MTIKLFTAVSTSLLGGGGFAAYNEIQEKKQSIKKIEQSVVDAKQKTAVELVELSEEADRLIMEKQSLRISKQKAREIAHQNKLADLKKQLINKNKEIVRLEEENNKVIAQDQYLCRMSQSIIAYLNTGEPTTTDADWYKCSRDNSLVTIT